eukprot:2553371-Amphidinium_carterae.1
MCKWRGVSGEWQAVGTGRRGTRPPDSLRSWPGLDRNPPKVGGYASIKGGQASNDSRAGNNKYRKAGVGKQRTPQANTDTEEPECGTNSRH